MMFHLPRLVDPHVHFREPGLEHKATLATEATAAGATHAICCEMPNTIPTTATIAAFADKVARADKSRDKCDVRFYFGATELGHLDELVKLFTDPQHAELRKHCSGHKVFLCNSTGNLGADGGVIDATFQVCAKLGITLVAHCEHAATNDLAARDIPYTTHAAHSRRQPAESEVTSIRQAIAMAERYGTNLHVAHLSTAGGLELVREAKQRREQALLKQQQRQQKKNEEKEQQHNQIEDGNKASDAAPAALPIARVTCEVAPHHLLLTADEDYPTLQGRLKVNPPVRSMADRNALWEGLLDGTIDCIATDHAPHLLSEKDVAETVVVRIPAVADDDDCDDKSSQKNKNQIEREELKQPPSGLPGIETSLALMLSIVLGHFPHPTSPPPPSLLLFVDEEGEDKDKEEGEKQSTTNEKQKRFTIDDLVRTMRTRANEIFNLRLSADGKDERLYLRVDPRADRVLRNEEQKTKCAWTPYHGWKVRGTVELVSR